MTNQTLLDLIHERVRTVTAFAKAMNVTTATVYTWIKEAKVPIGRVRQLSRVLNLDLAEALALASPEEADKPTPGVKTLPKPEGTLADLVAVQRGTRTLEDVSQELGVSLHALTVSYAQNEHRLPLMYEVLTGVTEGTKGVEEACEALGVTRSQLYYLMRHYGQPLPTRATYKEPGRYTQGKAVYQKLALDVIAGRTTALQAAEEAEVALRTLHRHVKRLTPHKLNNLAHWPSSFRLAYAQELQGKAPKLVESWVEYAYRHGLILCKNPRALPPVRNWKREGWSRMLIALLLGEVTLEELAAARGGSERALKDAFDGTLKPFHMRFGEVMALPVLHQAALADLLTMEKSKYRSANRPLVGEPNV